MSLNKLIVVIGIAALAIQSTHSAPTEADDCICTREYIPICASDNITYSNLCEFRCEKQQKQDLQIKFYGECDDNVDARPLDENDCTCTEEYFPVCGSDDQTYSNECMLNCERLKKSDLTLEYVGECGKEIRIPKEIDGEFNILPIPIEENCICVRIYDPVCGNDGETYSNECELNCEQLKKADLALEHRGKCEEATPYEADDCICTRVYAPVCGTNDKTYANECALNCARKNNKKLAVKIQGECNDINILPIKMPRFEESCICPALYAPVCGSDSVTYSNKCFLGCEQRKKADLTMAHIGRCGQFESI